MLRYTKNGPLRAPVCTSAQGTSHAALQWLLCSNTHLKTETEKATFPHFMGKLKLLESMPVEQAGGFCMSLCFAPSPATCPHLLCFVL